MYVSFDDLLELAHEDKQWAILEVALKFAKGDGVDRNDNLACEWIKKFIQLNIDEKNYGNIALVSGVYEREKLLPKCKNDLIDTYSLIYKDNPIIGNYLFGRSAYFSGVGHLKEATQRLELSANKGHVISAFLLHRIRVEKHKGIIKKIISIIYGVAMVRKLFIAKRVYGAEAFICWKDWFLKSRAFKRIFIEEK